MQAFAVHGGRLHSAMRAWPNAPKPWIDLSTGINPFAYPAPRASAAARRRLPDPVEIAELEAAAARAFGVADPARVLATAGAEAAIGLLPRLLPAGPALNPAVFIRTPTYGGHAAAWIAAGRPLSDDAEAAAVHVTVNPNNPDGRYETPAALARRADALAARGGWLVVDESFIESTGSPGVAALAHPRILALRSFGKFYGLPGLRLGFLVGEPAMIAHARALQGDWPVSADAIAAGLKAYADTAWAERTRAHLADAAHRMDAALEASGFRVLGRTRLFRLAEADNAADRFAALCAQGILIRPFADHPRWLRFGLPPAAARNRVAAALRSLA